MPNMDIVVEDLDLGYVQCKDLNEFAHETGTRLLDELKSNIDSLKQNWIASDATAHINNLIKVAKALGLLLDDAIKYTADAAAGMISIQQVRNSNGGGGQIGEPLNGEGPQVPNIPEVPETKEYRCNPGIINDKNKLASIGDSFDSFTQKFNGYAEELMSNWRDGSNHSEAQSSFSRFAEDAQSYKKVISDALENLTTAVTNLGRLGNR